MIGWGSDLQVEDDHLADRDMPIGVGLDAGVVLQDLLHVDIELRGNIFGGFTGLLYLVKVERNISPEK